MSSGNKVFCRGENPMGMFVPHNVPRANRQSNPQQCRRRMRTKQQGLSADGVAIFRANSLVRPLTVLSRKCQTTALFRERWNGCITECLRSGNYPSTNQKALL